MRLITFLLLFFSLALLSAQDTLRVMHYNLLYYGENTGFCNFNNNNPDLKDAYLRSIITWVKPDIFTVNEISHNSTYQERILQQVMNQTGYALFGKSGNPNIAESNIVNLLYFNTEKLALHSQQVLQSEVRDIDLYRMYHLSESLEDGDTVFINCIVAHLKAGSSSSDELERKIMTNNALDYLEANGRPGNYLFMGDFNVYDAAEAAFQAMINNNDPVFRFYDPVNAVGDWHSDANFRHVHTQSTHTSSGNCHAGGGMDDRFDFILMNRTLHDEADKVYYLEGSYHAPGQDGQRLNGSLLDPPNTSLPAYVLDALYGMSDHLPVVMDLVVDESLGVESPWPYSTMDIIHNNPVKDELRLRFGKHLNGPATLSILSASGSMVVKQELQLAPNSTIAIDMNDLPSGFYLLSINSGNNIFTGKMVVVR